MTLPSISIITPSYNQAAFLEATIRSVLDQGYPHLQYGVVDGGSTDGSIEIIERYRDRLDFAIIEADGGQSEAINKGLRRATGEVVGWLCSDDLLAPGSLQRIGQHFADHPEDHWVAGTCHAIDSEGLPIGRMDPSDDLTLAGALLRGPNRPFCLPQPSVFWRRELLDKVGLLDESLHYCMDYDLWCGLFAHGCRLRRIAPTLASYRMHGASKSCAEATGFLREHLIVEPRYARYLPWRQRLTLQRWIGYRQRQLTAMTATGRPWRQVLKRPWWLGSQQIRSLLLHGPQHRHSQPPQAQTWDQVHADADLHAAAQRLTLARQSTRWQTFRNHLRSSYGDRALDCVELGSGSGDISVLLAQLGHRVTLVDFSRAALEHARRRFEALGLSAQFVREDIFEFSKRHAGAYDVSVSLGVAEHFEAELRDSIVAAHARVLRPGGTTLISVPHARCLPYRLWKLYLECRGAWPYGHEQPFTPAELRGIAQRSGLERCSTYNSGFAASVDACLLLPLTGRRRGWREGPAWLNKLSGWEVNLLAQRGPAARAA